VESHEGPVTYGPGDDFEAPVSSQAEGKGSKHKMPINLSNEEEANKGKIEETINIAGFTVSVTGLGLGEKAKSNNTDASACLAPSFDFCLYSNLEGALTFEEPKLPKL